MAGQNAKDGPTVIKKYANRRLYNTGSSSYITLDNLATMVRDEVDFVVIDAKSGDDITHAILTQIILEQEAGKGDPMLPVSFLRQLIGMYGNQMQSVMPAYLEASMAQFQEHQTKFNDAFNKGVSTSAFAKIAETNMAIMQAAAKAFIPGAVDGAGEPPETQAASPSRTASPSPDNELASMRKQMAAMQKRLDEMGN